MTHDEAMKEANTLLVEALNPSNTDEIELLACFGTVAMALVAYAREVRESFMETTTVMGQPK